MTELLTPADQFNLTLLHNIEEEIKRTPVKTYGPGEEPTFDAVECPFIVGKLYKTIAPTYLIELLQDQKYEPPTVASDIVVPEDSILIFLGAEKYFFEKNEYLDSFSIYTLRFLYGDAVYFDLVPARFTEDDIDWSYVTTANLSIYMKKVLRGSIELLETP